MGKHRVIAYVQSTNEEKDQLYSIVTDYAGGKEAAAAAADALAAEAKATA